MPVKKPIQRKVKKSIKMTVPKATPSIKSQVPADEIIKLNTLIAKLTAIESREKSNDTTTICLLLAVLANTFLIIACVFGKH